MFNNDLLRDLAEEKVALFLGAGVSASALIGDRPAFRGWPDFLNAAAESRSDALRNQVTSLVASKDYLLACQLLQDSYDDEWQDLVTAEYGKAAEPSPLHAALISLKQRIIITTNFDKLMEAAWSKNQMECARGFKVLSTINRDVFRVLKDYETPYLIKIHGSVDNAAGLVFSRSEYIRMAFGNENYANFLEAVLLNYTILFVGFSMDDPAISSLMEMYTLNYPGARPHYIISPQGGPENIYEINKKLRKLSMIGYEPDARHSNLPILIDNLARHANEKRRELLAARFTALGGAALTEL